MLRFIDGKLYPDPQEILYDLFPDKSVIDAEVRDYAEQLLLSGNVGPELFAAAVRTIVELHEIV